MYSDIGSTVPQEWTAPEAAGLALFRCGLFGGEYTPPAKTDFAAVLSFSFRHRIHGTVIDGISHLPEDALPTQQLLAWQKKTVAILRRNDKLAAVESELCAFAKGQGIRLVILKGSSVAHLYPSPELRMCGDIDCLVGEADLPRVCTYLREQGFESLTHRADARDFGFLRDGCHVEVHRAVAGLPQGKIGQALAAFLADTVPCAVHAHIRDYDFLAPAPAHQAVILLLHMQEHMHQGGLGLRQVGDYALFLSKEMTAEVAKELRPLLAECGLLRFAATLHLALVRHLGVPAECAPYTELADGQLADALMTDFVKSGNFGRDVPEYVGSAVVTAERKRGESTLGAAVGSVAEKCRRRWPAARKFPPLLAILMPYFVVQRQLRHDRERVNPVRMLRASRRRVKLYDALRFFEPEDMKDPRA